MNGTQANRAKNRKRTEKNKQEVTHISRSKTRLQKDTKTFIYGKRHNHYGPVRLQKKKSRKITTQLNNVINTRNIKKIKNSQTKRITYTTNYAQHIITSIYIHEQTQRIQ